jgi:hypothetical protein
MFDGDKPNSVSVIAHADDHLSRPNFSERPMRLRASRCDDTRGLNGPAALPLFCLAPHGVFPASRITPRAVSSYLAFSPLPVLLSKNRRCLFCDTFRHRNFATAAPAFFTRHVAVWCSDFPPASQSGSPAIICHRAQFITIGKEGKRTADRLVDDFNSKRCLDSARHDKRLEWRWHGQKENRDHRQRDN